MSILYTAHPSFTRVSYVGPSVTGSALQKLCLFTPDTNRYARPPNGWPVIVWHEMGGFRFTTMASTLGPNHLYLNATTPDNDATFSNKRFLLNALSRGWAVIFASVTIAFGDDIGNETTPYQVVGVANSFNPGGVPVADIEFVPNKNATDYDFGTAPDGNGICMPYNGGTFPTGYKDSGGRTQATGAIHPFQDPARHNCWMDSEMIAQFVRANAADMGIDLSMAYAAGESAGADVGCWTAYGPNRAPTRWRHPTGQELGDTRIYRGMIGGFWQPYINMLSNAYLDPRGPCRVPTVGVNILSNHYDVPGKDITVIDRADLLQGDAMTYATAAAIANNFTITYFTDSDTYNSGAGAGNGPWVAAVAAGVPTNPHDAYGLGLWKTLCGSKCVGYLLDTGTHPTCNVTGKIAYDIAANGYDQLHFRFLNFLESDCGMTRRWAFDPQLQRIART